MYSPFYNYTENRLLFLYLKNNLIFECIIRFVIYASNIFVNLFVNNCFNLLEGLVEESRRTENFTFSHHHAPGIFFKQECNFQEMDFLYQICFLCILHVRFFVSGILRYYGLTTTRT